MTSCTTRVEVDAGHRLLRHEGRCAHVHGHRYAFEVTVTASDLDDVGRVVDFGVVKERVGGWLERHVDHAMLVEGSDELRSWLEERGQRHLVLPYPPSAENLARTVFEVARQLLSSERISVERVVCRETPTCWAEYP